MEAGLLSKLPNKTLVMSNKNQFPFSFTCLAAKLFLLWMTSRRSGPLHILFDFFCLPQRPLNLCVHKRNVPTRGLLWCGVVCGGPGRARETAPQVKLLFAATSPDPHTTGLYQNSRCTLRWGVPSFQFGLFMWDIMIPIHTHAGGADHWVKCLTENIHT